jgi:hypothetical protein
MSRKSDTDSLSGATTGGFGPWTLAHAAIMLRRTKSQLAAIASPASSPDIYFWSWSSVAVPSRCLKICASSAGVLAPCMDVVGPACDGRVAACCANVQFKNTPPVSNRKDAKKPILYRIAVTSVRSWRVSPYLS